MQRVQIALDQWDFLIFDNMLPLTDQRLYKLPFLCRKTIYIHK